MSVEAVCVERAAGEQAPPMYPNPAHADRGEVLIAVGVGIGLMGAGIAAASAICPPCALGMLPLCAVTAPAVVGAGIVKRWLKGRRQSA